MKAPTLRSLAAADLPAYKALRDEMLLAHPQAFTSDAAAEARREPAEYLQRLGPLEGGHFVIGAWHGGRLVGAIGCERDSRSKVRHIGHVIGMMVRPEARRCGIGRSLLEACIDAARLAGLEMLTLTVTADNVEAVALYRSAGFADYGLLRGALKIGARYHDKLHMTRRI